MLPPINIFFLVELFTGGGGWVVNYFLGEGGVGKFSGIEKFSWVENLDFLIGYSSLAITV